MSENLLINVNLSLSSCALKVMNAELLGLFFSGFCNSRSHLFSIPLPPFLSEWSTKMCLSATERARARTDARARTHTHLHTLPFDSLRECLT